MEAIPLPGRRRRSSAMPACGMARIECGRSSGSRRPSTMARHALHTHREEAKDFREGVLGQRHARRISFHPVPTLSLWAGDGEQAAVGGPRRRDCWIGISGDEVVDAEIA